MIRFQMDILMQIGLQTTMFSILHLCIALHLLKEQFHREVRNNNLLLFFPQSLITWLWLNQQLKLYRQGNFQLKLDLNKRILLQFIHVPKLPQPLVKTLNTIPKARMSISNTILLEKTFLKKKFKSSISLFQL